MLKVKALADGLENGELPSRATNRWLAPCRSQEHAKPAGNASNASSWLDH